MESYKYNYDGDHQQADYASDDGGFYQNNQFGQGKNEGYGYDQNYYGDYNYDQYDNNQYQDGGHNNYNYNEYAQDFDPSVPQVFPQKDFDNIDAQTKETSKSDQTNLKEQKLSNEQDDSQHQTILAQQKIGDIQCNDGKMKIRIDESEFQGSGLKKHTIYRIKGHDSLGEIDVRRRYNEFFLYREMLFTRYPGLYIPAIPPKQANGNKAEFFIEERKYFLDQFLQKICEQPYLCSTPETQVFFRPKGKVEESFKSLQKTSTDIVLDYYKSHIFISNQNLPESQIVKYNQEINEFVKEQQVLMNHLKNFKQHIKLIVPMKQEELKYYKQFADFLQKYEESNEKSQTSLGMQQDGKENAIRLVSGDTKAHLKNKLDQLSQNLVNPFIHIRNWIKGEVMNLQALMAAIGEKESCDHRKQETTKKLSSDQELLEKLQTGKFSFKTMLKSSSSKAEQQHQIVIQIDQRRKDIENWERIKLFLTIYLAEIAIPQFREKKVKKYVEAMQKLSIDELKNAQQHQDCWQDFYDLTKAFQKL